MKKSALGTYDIAKICHVAPITVGRWIDEGKLRSFTTGGGHRRVWEEDLVKFLHAHSYPIPNNLKSASKAIVLIVDDETNVRRVVKRCLEKNISGLEITEASDGFEAGEKVNLLVPALVILDIHLPGISGVKVCERIRANKALKKVKILAITGAPTETLKKEILNADADAFLAKPFDLDLLTHTAQKLLGLK